MSTPLSLRRRRRADHYSSTPARLRLEARALGWTPSRTGMMGFPTSSTRPLNPWRRTSSNTPPGSRFDATWTPIVLILDSNSVERHRNEGYLPKNEFRAQLELGLARIGFKAKKWADAERATARLFRSMRKVQRRRKLRIGRRSATTRAQMSPQFWAR
jgi:hypothetical protein